MSDYYNPYIRLQTYYNWLINDRNMVLIDENYDFGIPMVRLQEITKIPIEVIRQDMITLFQWQSSLQFSIIRQHDDQELSCKNMLEFDEDSPEYRKINEMYDIESLYDQISEGSFPKKLERFFLDGLLDPIPIHIYHGQPQSYHISLTPEEAEALHSYQSTESAMSDDYQKFRQTYDGTYAIKDSYQYNHHYIDLNQKLDKINQAINTGQCLKIKYNTAKNKILSFYFKPLKIAYDATENLYSVISIYQDQIRVHRLDQILSVENCSETIETTNMELLAIAPNVWGCCFSEQPEHVKIKFYPEANVWDKVRKDLAYRTNGTLYEKDGFLYYEDTVYGISKLRSWIYGYGSSAIVLEPESLRNHIIHSLKARKEQG